MRPLTDTSTDDIDVVWLHQVSASKKFPHSGIPAAPFAKRNVKGEVTRSPVVYLKCEFDSSIELPFGDKDSMAANIQNLRTRRKQRESSSRFLRGCLYSLMALVMLASTWYLVSLVLGDFGFGRTSTTTSVATSESSFLDTSSLQAIWQCAGFFSSGHPKAGTRLV
jgi:uncharacterized membrane protein YbhN (UPF0104 family)